MDLETGVYAIVCLVNGKAYIGSTTDSFKSRFSGHVNQLIFGNHHSSKLQRAWNKYGESQFVLIIIERVRQELCLIIEQFYLDAYQPYVWGYNCSKSATSCVVDRTGEEYRSLRSQLARKQWLENREKMVESLKGVKKTPREPVEMTDEWRKNISKGKIGKKHKKPRSPEHIRKLIESRKRNKAKVQ